MKKVILELGNLNDDPRTRKVFAGIAVICLCFVFAAGASAQQPDTSTPTFTAFEVPGAATGASQGTFGAGLNTAGAMAGVFVDANNLQNGFVRNPTSGAMTTFGVPGGQNDTHAVSVNTAGR